MHRNKFMSLGLLIGGGFGIIFGLIINKLAIFLSLGAGIGVLIGFIVDAAMYARKSD